MPDFYLDWLPESDPGIRVLKLRGPFTLNAVFEFQAAVRQPADALTILDLSDVPYMDSAALGSLLGLHVSCQTHKRGYAVVGASERLKTLFRVSGVQSLLILAESIDHAKSLTAWSASA